ncbi:MAG: hypothetical protein ACRCT3_07395 [Aeromonas hydrophila]
MSYNLLDDNALVLAAEDFGYEQFQELHYFTKHDRRCISKLQAHGPVLLRGARGSGKSALMIEAYLNLYPRNKDSNVFGIYLSLRHLGLLRSKGKDYETLLCSLIVRSVNSSFGSVVIDEITSDISTLQLALSDFASQINKRIVILFDDAAHIGRETSLNEFFDIFRTLSSSVVSCKASIYPGVTQFGTRFDVYNDATVIDVIRSENSHDFSELLVEVMNKRFPASLPDHLFQGSFTKSMVAELLGRAVLGNMRAYMFSCNALISALNGHQRLSFEHFSESFKSLSNDYYWPLLEEIQPKLGIYEPMVDPAIEIATTLFEKAGAKTERTVIILREINQRLSKPLEILEYAGFISRREVSRAMKSRGRGSRYALNLCNIMDYVPGGRITKEHLDKWFNPIDESVEFHKGSNLFSLTLPEPDLNQELGILSAPVNSLKQSNIYPYGITEHKLSLLTAAGYSLVEDLLEAKDEDVLAIDGIGPETLKRIKSTLNQAIWM